MFIAKDKDLIVAIGNTREELEEDLVLKNYDVIETTAKKYVKYNGSYLTQAEADVKEQERIDNLKMTALDFLNFLKVAGLTDEQVEDYLNSHLEVKHQLQFCQNVYCGVAKALMPIEYEGVTITAEMVEIAFKNKNGEN